MLVCVAAIRLILKERQLLSYRGNVSDDRD